MRLVFLVLVFANVAFFAWTYYDRTVGSQGERIIAQQLDPGRIRLVSRDEAARLARIRQPACIEWGPIGPNDVARAEDAIAGLQAGLKIENRRPEESAGWWVYIPPFPSRQAANQRVAELRRLGIEDYFIIPDDAKFRNAVSLGVFRNEEAAKGRFDALQRRGVRDAVLAERDGSARRVYLRIPQVTEALRERIGELRTAFPGSEVRDCPAADGKG
ncbi:MAG: SPOR domain-containing protein [Burkholderiales bacterium]|nr:SPOR domain-containing protein [Burkholderiales bacterium]